MQIYNKNKRNILKEEVFGEDLLDLWLKDL